MSHLKERTGKNCLNCNAQVQGRFCHVCGQENIETFETVWHLITHFFNDITHFDGKFFSTTRYLIFKPGFLSREYMLGRRASYLNPIRMYIFTSFFFFLIFFMVVKSGEDVIETQVNNVPLSVIEKMDSVIFREFTASLNKGIPMSRELFDKYIDSAQDNGRFSLDLTNYKSRDTYEADLKSGKVKDNWLERQLTYRAIGIKQKYKGDNKLINGAILDSFLHSFPQILFISLPLFALLLKLLYVRRKEFYYTGHAIFSIHLYVFVFLVLLITIGIDQLHQVFDYGIFDYLKVFLVLLFFFYEYKAMRVFYKQRRAKTILKFVLLNFTHLIVLVLLFVIFFVLSMFKI